MKQERPAPGGPPAGAGVAAPGGGAGADARYWLDSLFSRLIPACVFSLFLAYELILLTSALHSLRRPADYLDVLNRALALAYFTLLVVMYVIRLPRLGTDRRALVILVSLGGTFAILGVGLLPRVPPRAGLALVADLLITAGLAWAVWGLAYLRRSFSIIP